MMHPHPTAVCQLELKMMFAICYYKNSFCDVIH